MTRFDDPGTRFYSHEPEVFAYHERTKHQPFRYAAALGYMDWATQPDPFRRFAGAPLIRLELVEQGSDPPRRIPAGSSRRISAATLDLRLALFSRAGSV